MNRYPWLDLSYFLLLTFASAALVAPAEPGEELREPTYDIPHLRNVTVDGDSADWRGDGFRFAVLASEWGDVSLKEDFDAAVSLAWDKDGLLVFARVVDDDVQEEADLNRGDHISLVFSPPGFGDDRLTFTISPGVSKRFDELRIEEKQAAVDAIAARTDSGYDLELRLKWKALHRKSKKGLVFSAQCRFRDRDEGEFSRWAYWRPLQSGVVDLGKPGHRLRLASEASAESMAVATIAYEQFRRAKVRIYAPHDWIGQEFQIGLGDSVVAQGLLMEGRGRAFAELKLGLREASTPTDLFSILVEGRQRGLFQLPNLDQEKAWALFNSNFLFRPCVFSGEHFPPGDFEHPLLVEEVVGPYEVNTTYYDAGFREVEMAKASGRYGAVVEVKPVEGGRSFFRFCTLFRLPDEVNWHIWEPEWKIDLPRQLGFDARVIEDLHSFVVENLKWNMVDGFNHNPGSAAVLAALHEATADDDLPEALKNPLSRDRQWWVTLRRKLDGSQERYPGAFVAPVEASPPAPVLRYGSAAEANMKADAALTLDHLLNEWSDHSDEAFSVCLARHGIIFLHKAYGDRGSRPLRLRDSSWLASISKLLGGVSMMMLVDQGLVGLDDPITRFFPDIQVSERGKPLTIRHLFTHTSGMTQHSGVFMHDLEERLAYLAPHLRVAREYHYNGTDNELAGKVIEMISGESLTHFFQRHLLDPLGCTDSAFHSMSWMSYATAFDLAKVGQMLLNRGAYGEWRFFTEDSYRAMLPRTLAGILGYDPGTKRGIGSQGYRHEGWSEETFGHGAASSTTFRMDPKNELVVVMTRNQAGSNFRRYHPKFLKAIADNLGQTLKED